MESLRELYRIGPGPSSSHTLAVQKACLHYLSHYPDFSAYQVDLYGSLALTGKGHMSDRIIEQAFEGKTVKVNLNCKQFGKEPNTMVFHTGEQGVLANEMIIYSIGGGALSVEGIGPLADPNVYTQTSFEAIRKDCLERRITLAQYVYEHEPDIKPYLREVVEQMLQCVHDGLQKSGVLPGSLKLEKIAAKIYRKARDCDDASERERLLLTSYAYAAMEENACGNTVVTAPTLGSCGILSGLVNHYYESGVSMDLLINGLAVAGVFGNLVKQNASISGAKGGCQAEVGTACSMGAAFAAYQEHLNIQQIEMAAEIAMEHQLGLTCDPVGGYVQVPCIERNGVGILRSMDAMLYAKYMQSFKENKVSFDKIVEAMNLTGNRIAMELRETSLGGLAEVLPQKIDNEQGCY